MSASSPPESAWASGIRGLLGSRRLWQIAIAVLTLSVVGNVALSLGTTDRDVLDAALAAPKGPLLVALGLALVSWITGPVRLQVWAGFLGHPIPFLEALRLHLAALLGSAVTPTSTGGSLLRWGMLYKRGIPAGTIASLVTIGTAEDAVFFAVALPLAVLWSASGQEVVGQVADVAGGRVLTAVGIGLAVVAALVVVAVLLAWLAARGGLGRGARRRVRRGLARGRRQLRTVWADAVAAFRLVGQRGKSRFVLTLTLTAIEWGTRYSVATAVLVFLDVAARPALFWALQWAVFTLSSVVPTPGGVGGAEAAFGLLYAPLVPTAVLATAVALWRFSVFYFPLALGALLFPVLSRSSSRRREAS